MPKISFFHRLRCLALLSCATLIALPAAVQAQAAYPAAKAISVIVPYPAGGASDAGARIFAQPFSTAIGQSVLIENIGGATGTIAANRVLNGAADGYNLFYGSPNEVILSPLVNSAIKFKPEDFTLVHPLSISTLVLAVRPGLHVKTLDEFITLARQSSNAPLTYGTVGIGSLYHLLTDHLGRKIGSNFNHIPYKGTANVINDLAGGQIDFAILPYQASLDGMVRENRMQLLSSFSRTLPPSLQHIPTIDQSRLLKDFEFNIWGGIFVKKGTPEPVLASIRNAVISAMKNPDLRKRMESEGRIPMDAHTAQQVAEMQREQIATYRALIKSLDFKAL